MLEAVHRIQLPYLFTGYQDIKIRKDGTNMVSSFFVESSILVCGIKTAKKKKK